jgi:hypothetical protein
VPQLPHAGLLADLAAQVVELRPVDVADRGDLDLLDLREMQRERPLDADPKDCFRTVKVSRAPRTLALQDDALEDLDPGPLALDHLEMDANVSPP